MVCFSVFLVGAICSALAGFLGMRVATKANNRTTNAAQRRDCKSLECCIYWWICYGSKCCWFRSVRSYQVYLLFMIFSQFFDGSSSKILMQALTGFSLVHLQLLYLQELEVEFIQKLQMLVQI